MNWDRPPARAHPVPPHKSELRRGGGAGAQRAAADGGSYPAALITRTADGTEGSGVSDPSSSRRCLPLFPVPLARRHRVTCVRSARIPYLGT